MAKKLRNRITAYKNSKKIKKNIRKHNPSILSFNNSSQFIYEPKFYYLYTSELNDNNSLKPNQIEINKLKSTIKNFSRNDEEENIIFIKENVKLVMLNIKRNEPKIDNKAKLIEEIIQENSSEGHISIRKITSKYNEICLIKGLKNISKTQVHRIVKNVLLLSYRKTIAKNIKLLNSEFIKYGYFFLKIFLRCLSCGLNAIYLDEAGFYSNNKNFYTWRKSNQVIYQKIEDKKKINLLMAVSNNKIFHYMIIQENTDNKIFQKFMNQLIEKMTDEEKMQNFLVMDNLSCHLTSDLFSFYHDKKLKILLNVPYQSAWNMIELVFRLIKNHTYKRLYKNRDELENGIIKIIESGKIEETLNSLYAETLIHYLNFINKNKEIDLNK